ncbi:hypothetical protein IWW39_005783 [Coemansia spiralis]|uniref:Conserved oligomeric Golgi complex subunit 8 n=1 Tax=Coemansia spiralis TaxID=417178 RepID=A0A9W8L1F8_9FUNG|nr:hypothetical protein IWW39_005783 [Coemansia spiralis]
MATREDSESLYGSSIYPNGRYVDDADLPEYAQLCRRLFPTLLSSTDDHDVGIEPETEENMARYLKYLTGLPLSSLKMEPALLQSDLQRISNELTLLLLNETAKPVRESGEFHSGLRIDRALDKDLSSKNTKHVFNVVHETNKLSTVSAGKLSENLANVQESLSRLETACGRFAATASDLDQRAKVVQRVLDKQELITRIVELPRVMQMCVAGGYYEEAVELAEHVRITGDRLVRDISDGVQTLLGSRDESPAMSVTARNQLVGFVSAIQKQVHAEFEAMVLALCRELSYARSAAVAPTQRGGTGLRSSTDVRQSSEPALESKASVLVDGGNSYEKSMKRLSQMSKIVAILRNVGIFSETELCMLYLRSRWQAWLVTEESLSGHAPGFLEAADSLGTSIGSPNLAASQSSSSHLRRGSERGPSSGEVAAYLTNYIDAFFSWLAEVDLQYRTLFSSRVAKDKPSDPGMQPGSGVDPFADLALYSSQKFQSSALPLLDLVTEASGISSLQVLVATHSRVLSRSGIDFAVPALALSLRERGFISVVRGVEESTALACQKLETAARDYDRLGADKAWDQLATSTRPSLGLPDVFSVSPSAESVDFLSCYRVSPVGLLQYPIWAQLLHSFRECLHALRILVLTSDSANPGSDSANEGLILLSMVSIVLESELIRTATALASLCEQVSFHADGSQSPEAATGERDRMAARDSCVAFVFGLVRNVAEIFEEVATLCEDASTKPTITLFSEAIYAPLVAYL